MNYLHYNKLKFKSDIFKSNKSIVYKFFIKIFFSKNLSAKYHQENKEQLQKKACERYQNLPKEEKEKKRQYGREGYKNLSEDEKHKLV